MYGYEAAAARRSGSYIHLQAAARSGATALTLKQQQNHINFFEIFVDKARNLCYNNNVIREKIIKNN